MMKQFFAVYLLWVCMAQKIDGVMKNKLVFHLNSGSSTYYCVKGILHTIILYTTSLITVTLSVKR